MHGAKSAWIVPVSAFLGQVVPVRSRYVARACAPSSRVAMPGPGVERAAGFVDARNDLADGVLRHRVGLENGKRAFDRHGHRVPPGLETERKVLEGKANGEFYPSGATLSNAPSRDGPGSARAAGSP